MSMLRRMSAELGLMGDMEEEPVPRQSSKVLLADQRASIAYKPVATAINGEPHHVHAFKKSRNWGADLLDSPTFQNCMAVVIILNAAVIGMETDLPRWILWTVLEAIFLLIFLGEVGFKMYVEGYLFFVWSEPDFWWNIFDFFIVGLGLIDQIAETIGFTENGGGVTVTLFRMVRLLRVLRILRLLKVLKRLYLLAVGLVEACKAIIWVTVLMSMVLYVFSIVLVKTVGRPPADDPHADFMYAHFHSIGNCMLTLFILMSSPNLPVYQEEVGLLDSRPMFCVFLVLFITFGSFGMIAMLTGVINESMFENNEMKQQEKRDMHEAMRQSLATSCADLYETLPMDDLGRVRVTDLETIAASAALLLDATGIPIAHGDISKFFQLMDEEETGWLTLKDFVQAMEKIAEGNSPLAIVEIQHHAALCHKKVTQQIETLLALEERHEKITAHISEEVDRILAAIENSGMQHRTHFSEKLESQIQSTSQEVDRIVRAMSDGHNEHRSHLEEKLDAQMRHISKEVDRILQVVSGDGGACISPTNVAKQLEPNVQGSPDFRRCAPSSLAAPLKEIPDVGMDLQRILDHKFSALETQLFQKSIMESLDKQLPPEPKLLPAYSSEPKIDQILSLVDVLCKKEDIVASLIASLRIDFARLLQESKNAVVRAEKTQEAVDENVDFLIGKVSGMQKESDSLQAQLLSSVAELGGEIISKVSDLISGSLMTMKQELVMQRFNVSSPLSRDVRGSTPPFSPTMSLRSSLSQVVRAENSGEHSSMPARASRPQSGSSSEQTSQRQDEEYPHESSKSLIFRTN